MNLFQEAKRHAPCIVFIDEIDAVGRQRGIGVGGGHDEREQTLNQILVEMDGFDKHTNIIVVAATNRPDVLDPALLRPGRFDRRVVLDSPDLAGRMAILRVHARGKPLASDVDLGRIARQTAGFSGADIENVLNEAAILAARAGRRSVEERDLEEAVDRVMTGPARRSRLLTTREKVITAYHEAGHALVAHLLPNVDPVHKITIVAARHVGRPDAPPADRRPAPLDPVAAGRYARVCAGGHGCRGSRDRRDDDRSGNDLEHATMLARRMVCEFGMSAEIGPVALKVREGGFAGVGERVYSDQTADVVDQEVRKLIQAGLDRARAILEQQRDRLDLVALLLLRHETLHGDDLQAALEGRALVADRTELARALAEAMPTATPGRHHSAASQLARV